MDVLGDPVPTFSTIMFILTLIQVFLFITLITAGLMFEFRLFKYLLALKDKKTKKVDIEQRKHSMMVALFMFIGIVIAIIITWAIQQGLGAILF